MNKNTVLINPKTGTPTPELLRWMTALNSVIDGTLVDCTNVPVSGLKQKTEDNALQTTAAVQAAANASQAVLDLSTAVDGKIESYYQDTAPASPDYGDLWIDTDDGNRLYWWNNLSWQDAQDSQINTALTQAATADGNALAALTAANGAVKTYYQDATPSGPSSGDLWIETDNDNKLWRYNGTSWEDGQDNGIQTALANAATALSDSALAQATADGKILTFQQPTPPTADGFGDIWLDSDDGNLMYRWDNTQWVSVQDNAIATAISNAATAQSTADGKVVTFRQAGTPVAEGLGDLWIDSDDDNKVYRWDGTSWIDSHDPNIFAALTQANAAYNLADSKIDIFYQTSAPSSPDTGDLWVDTDAGNALTRWNGSSWEVVGAGDAAAALAAANSAQATADGKVSTFIQASAPTAEGVGDLWFDSDDKNKPYRWSGSSWALVRDSDIAQALTDAANSLTQANAAFNLADGKITSYYQTSAPSVHDTGDLWIDTNDNNKLYRWNGSSWVSAQDSRIGQAIVDASTAQATADGKVTTFYQTSAPSPEGIGDLWIDSNDSNHLYRYNGSSWVSQRDGTIVAAQSAASAASSAASAASSAASAAQSTANGKNTTWRQSWAPSAYNSGDVWYDTGDGNKPHVWNGSSWVDSTFFVTNLAAFNAYLGTVTTGKINGVSGAYLAMDGSEILLRSPGGGLELRTSNNSAGAQGLIYVNYLYPKTRLEVFSGASVALNNASVVNLPSWTQTTVGGLTLWVNSTTSSFLQIVIDDRLRALGLIV